MNLTFISDSPLNSTVIDLQGGTHLYDISTKVVPNSPQFKSTTTLTDPRGDVIAVWERAHLHEQDRITYHGQMHTLADWLPKKNVLSRTRMLVGPGGERYHWKQASNWGSSIMKLITPESERVLVQVRSARSGLFSSKDRRLSLSVEPDATFMLDDILLSFIVLYQMRREQGAVSADTGVARSGGFGYGMLAGSMS